MQASDTHEKIEALIACGPLKAWSVIVTILGDLCQSRQDRVQGRQLNELMGQMGISDQTVRVAIHRLRRDGWVESHKQGRDAAYALSASGWRETQAVRDRIYAPGPPAAREVLLAVAPPSMAASAFSDALPDGAVQVAPRTALLDRPASTSEDLWVTPISAKSLPVWLRSILAEDGLCADYDRLTEAVQKALAGTLSTDPVQRLTLRLLALHHWRRLRLRHGDLPDLLLGPDWSGAQARRTVMTILNTIPRPNADT